MFYVFYVLCFYVEAEPNSFSNGRPPGEWLAPGSGIPVQFPGVGKPGMSESTRFIWVSVDSCFPGVAREWLAPGVPGVARPRDWVVSGSPREWPGVARPREWNSSGIPGSGETRDVRKYTFYKGFGDCLFPGSGPGVARPGSAGSGSPP